MKICILSSKMGTPQHLVVDENSDTFSWVKDPPNDMWTYGSRDNLMSLDVLADLHNIEIGSLFPEEHERAFRALCMHGSPGIPWHLAISPDRFRRALQSIIRGLQRVLEVNEATSYGQTFMHERKFILGLSKAHVDKDKIRTCMASETNATVRSSLRTFFPKDDPPMTPPTKYSQVSTHTGRLTVTTGPQILTLPSRCRDIITSRFDGGEIVQVDFVSVEPRLARLVMGRVPKNDVYQEICDTLFSSDIDRKTAKIAVLCALYGASTVRLQRILGEGFDARTIVRKLRDYFGVDALGVRLRSEVAETGAIVNWFGRKIHVERTSTNVLVNNYIQSSAVDVALLGFRDLMERMREMGLETTPIFLIHDALVLDVPSREGNLVRETAALGINVPNIGNFPLKVDVIS
jgi:hypothetical protein